MKKIILIGITIALLYSFYKAHQKNIKYIRYLKSVGIPDKILSKMKAEEIKAAALYLNRYAKTHQHFQLGDKDYKILSEIRTKYGIFM